jgi:L-threonylcarbamoyladenylate synthase
MLVILEWTNDADLLRQLETRNSKPETCHLIAHTRIPSGTGFASVSVIPHDAEAFARAIYAELHRCDEAGAEMIVVEALPKTVEWRAISDRLSRAATNE